jgi:translation elongation factor EF-1beta
MISIIRLKSQERKERICDYVMSQVNELQESIKGKGQLLYLSKRAKHEDISLFVHMVDPDILGDFIAEHLNKIEDVTGIWVINMIKPVFYPLPQDTKNMKRFAITMKVFPKNLKDVYRDIATAALPDGLKMAYIAYTFHLFGDCIQFSILAEKEETLNKYLTEVVNKIPGVLSTTVNLIERTRPLVSYDEWKQYSSEYGIIPSWDEALMIKQFQG